MPGVSAKSRDTGLILFPEGYNMKTHEAVNMFRNYDTSVSKAMSRKIAGCIKALGLDRAFANYLIRNRYKVHGGGELTEGQAHSFLEHLKGYGGSA
jgi:hypothetical protein